MENPGIARTLDEAAARTITALDRPVLSLGAGAAHALEALPGIGADLAGKIVTLASTGDLPLLHELTRATPESLVTLLRLPGVGPKRARLIYEQLGVRTLEQLDAAARAGRLSKLRGIGPALEQQIRRGLTEERARVARFTLAEAEASVRSLVEVLRAEPGVRQVEVAGSLRRRADTVGDVDLLCAVGRGSRAAERFVGFGEVAEVLAEGPTRCAVRLRSGLPIDLRLAGVAIVISTDAQRADELQWMRYGVDQARRGWCTAADIANPRDLDGFRARLRS